MVRDFHGKTKFFDFRQNLLVNVDFYADSDGTKISLIGQYYGR